MKHCLNRRFRRSNKLLSFVAVIVLLSFSILSVTVLIPAGIDLLPWEVNSIFRAVTCQISEPLCLEIGAPAKLPGEMLRSS